MELFWSTAALSDLENIVTHAETRDPAEAANILARVERTLEHIKLFPHSGYYNEELETYERYVPRTRVVLVYHLSDAGIEIIAAFHTSRDPTTKRRSRT